jgi:hopanoid biosynthesis associated RND transporter like protein HpnN
MPAERMPHAQPSLLARPMQWATRWVLRRPGAVIGGGLLLAVLALFATAMCLTFHTSRLDLLNPDSGYNQRWLAYREEFGEQDDALIVVEGSGRDDVVPVLEELAESLSHEPKLFQSVLYKKDLTNVRAKGLHFLSVPQLQQLDGMVYMAEPVLRGDWNQLSLMRLTEGAAARLSPQSNAPPEFREAAQADLMRLTDSLAAALDDAPSYQSPWPHMAELSSGLSQLDSEYLLSNEGRLGFVLLALGGGENQFDPGAQAIDRLRHLIAEVRQRHPEVSIGLTGMSVLENDEMRASQADMIQASILSLIGVSCLFIAGFGGVRYPLMTVATLLLGMAWAFGYITLAVGHLNILSVAFGVILIGLGIDFGIHYVARYMQLRRTIHDSETALIETASSVGPGIITGGVTTALAFFTAALTHFTGIAELGIVAAGGILLCLAGALMVLPAMIHLGDRQRAARRVPETLPLEKFIQPLLQRFPRHVLAVTLSATALLAMGAALLEYDHNLLNLQPTRLESVELEREVLTHTDRSVWFGLSVARSQQELLRRKAQFEQLDCVDRTEEIASLWPERDEEKSQLIARIRQRLLRLPGEAPVIPVESPERIEQQLTQTQSLFLGSDDSSRESRWRIQQVREQLRSLPPPEVYQRLSALQHGMASELLEQLRLLRSMADPEPPRVADVPEPLVSRFVGKNGRHLLKVYARGDVWDMQRLERFVKDIESIDPDVTGHPVQTFYASRHMQQSYLHAACYSLLSLAIVLMLDFRSIGCSLLAMFPLGLGMLQMFGVLGFLEIPLNPANMIVLPLILGIGIDNGVHIVHDYLRQSGPYRLSRSTATAVVITSATTMVGFGTMMFARHQGLRSLGQVLTIGVFCCLISSIVILPALLVWLTRHRLDEEAEDEEPAEEEPAEQESHDDEPPPAASPVTRWIAPRRVVAREPEESEPAESQAARSPPA